MWRRGGSILVPRPLQTWHRMISTEAHDKLAIAAAPLQNLVDNTPVWPKFMEAPVNVASGFLDTVHSATGAPWWIVLISSTVAMKTVLFPLTVYELKKTTKLLQNVAKLPKPVPKLGSGISPLQQYKLFSQKRKELGLPSPMWFLAPFAVQMPLFITWIMTIRYMAMNRYPGFDTGGALWFTDLTVPVDGFPGIMFPVSVALLFITNLEIALKGIGKKPGYFGAWITVYRWWLRACTIPILMSGFYLPQGVYMYWLPNSLFTLCQTLVIISRPTRKVLGLPVMPPLPEVVSRDAKTDSGTLVKLASEHFGCNNINAAIECLRLAVKKDPEDASIYYFLGNVHSGAGQWAEAAKTHNLALSKAKNDVDLKLSASLALGIALYNQGKAADGFSALKAVGDMEVPSDGMSRKKYYMALVTLGSMLSKHGQKAEALEYFERVAKYDAKIEDMLVKPIKKELAELEEQKLQEK